MKLIFSSLAGSGWLLLELFATRVAATKMELRPAAVPKNVWSLAKETSRPGDDCGGANSPPCKCTDWKDLGNSFLSIVSEGETPECDEEKTIDMLSKYESNFSVWTHSGDDPEKCANFAVEISGGFGNEEGIKVLAEKLLAASGSGNVDVFAHIFVGKKEMTDEVATALKTHFGKHLRKAVIELWSDDLHSTIERTNDRKMGNAKKGALTWLAEDLKKRHKVTDSGKTFHEGLIHALSMWRKIYMAHSLRAAYDKERTGKCQPYDLVMRARPDMVLTQNVDLNLHKGKTVDTIHALCSGLTDLGTCTVRGKEWPDTACWADDQAAIGNPLAMNAYAFLYPNFARFAYWYPAWRGDGGRHLAERLVGTYLDWVTRFSSKGTCGGLKFNSKMPDDSPMIQYGLQGRAHGTDP